MEKKLFKNLFCLLLLFLLQSFIPNSSLAKKLLLDSLAGSWDNLDSYVTLGHCANAPYQYGVVACSPAQYANVRNARFEADGFVSATESALDLADSVKNEEIKPDDINKLFSAYNYSEAFLTAQLSVAMKNFYFGINPLRIQGQFQVHNPNLPFASVVYRQDLGFFLGAATSFSIGTLKTNLGAKGTYLFRKETMGEATLLDFASVHSRDIFNQQKKIKAAYADLGITTELPDIFSLSATLKDLGK